MIKKLLYIFSLFLISFLSYSQDVSLFTQLNGNYDFTFVGNTMNTDENNNNLGSVTTTSSTASLNLTPNDVVIKAYLYWAGSGDGDFEVDLNGTTITPDRTFSHSRFFAPNTYTYFSAFKDITSFVQATGNGNYTLSNLDISPFEQLHLIRKTNFAGWAILIIYENNSLPLNQINVYDGLQGVPEELTINLTDLFVVNNSNASVGFIAWEGDLGLPTETFTVNNNILSNALNPEDNVFNGTNSITEETNLYNMDLDIYSIENYIFAGDTSASISLSSWQDFIMINTVVTKLNSQLPDATVTIDNVHLTCDSREIILNYTVYNINSTNYLPANTPVSFYANGGYLTTIYTTNNILVDGQESGSTTVVIPDAIPINFTLTAVADINSSGNGTVIELIETNNSFTSNVSLWSSPTFNVLPNVEMCNLGNSNTVFNFSEHENIVKTSMEQIVSFYSTYNDAVLEINSITNTSSYETIAPTEIFVRIENENCFSITSFYLTVKNCPPIIYNGISANNDNLNDVFFIDGLRDVFLNFQINIYNRWGKLIWTGNNNTEDWNGYAKNGLGYEKVPAGTYFYILNLNDENYPDAIAGYLYITY
jgi:gliding motility-associated-like protein